ncbi:MAG: ROK family protein [Actinobacteria bacterium]|nr:ROK family protein [Actinomycetota bacterium]MSX10683.1 ROK family protein [Actinomycetota bacterium]MSX68440.1 ROK family protein [Actinomycetota bacterium]
MNPLVHPVELKTPSTTHGTGSGVVLIVAIVNETKSRVGDNTCLAIDIGGTKLACGIVAQDGTLLERDHVATTKTDDPEVLFETLMTLVNKVRSTSSFQPSKCGVGCGGPMEPHGRTVSPLNISAWREFPLAERLRRELGLPIAIDNDAKAFALAEGWLGAARGVPSYLAMVVSTGVGGGIVLDGRLLDGQQGNAGHIGHIVVDPEGVLCRCGVRGCLEAEASGTAIELKTGRPASEADEEVRRATGVFVGRAVASVVTLLDLELCVVAGSVALGYGATFFEAAQQELERCTGLSYAKGARILPAGLGDAGPLVGAAAVGYTLGSNPAVLL